MAARDPAKIVELLHWVSEEKKSFDAVPSWTIEPYRMSNRLQLVVALKLGGILRSGVSIRLVTPEDSWEEDVYGQLEVRVPGMNRPVRLNPIEWRPLRFHDNPPNAPIAHRSVRLWDRWHPFDINAPLGLPAFDQTGTGIAVPLPRAPNSFQEYSDLCADLWKCPDMMGIKAPPWSRRLV